MQHGQAFHDEIADEVLHETAAASSVNRPDLSEVPSLVRQREMLEAA